MVESSTMLHLEKNAEGWVERKASPSQNLDLFSNYKVGLHLKNIPLLI